jgi:hypothetical protein
MIQLSIAAQLVLSSISHLPDPTLHLQSVKCASSCNIPRLTTGPLSNGFSVISGRPSTTVFSLAAPHPPTSMLSPTLTGPVALMTDDLSVATVYTLDQI